ncbi:hypothetical protein [Thioalkalivibrio sp. XN279]|uniref:hypothetical protein n=1 Tax=Thioalkalivibrio sp. XN279 TaxID=2714953 RepID=UPI0014078BAC|nr:hypothetical protein [Thioalkalivibrio sp. XN279]NHA13423.1 hypothetical protein [Thioalkalivibrio sp. XN279]
MDTRQPPDRDDWDPYAVWQILLHRHPVKVADVSVSSGHIERGLLAEFCEVIADYPDFLQDALLLIAHAKGVEAATVALDEAVRAQHAQRLARNERPRNLTRRG